MSENTTAPQETAIETEAAAFNAEASIAGAASRADAESREILNLLDASADAGGSCCGGACCA